jgi:transposase-like protein
LTGKRLLEIIKTVRKNGAAVVSDDFKSYNILDKAKIKNEHNFSHFTANHSLGQYVDGDIHTNGVEGIWPPVKRERDGACHRYGVKYTRRHINKFEGALV